MIYFNSNIRNPWWSERFQNIWNIAGPTPIKNKYWELQVIKNDNLFRIEFEWSIRQDHAGINLELGVLGYEIHFTLYDNRHWDYDKGCWQSYDE